MKYEYLSKCLQEWVTARLCNLKVVHIPRITRRGAKITNFSEVLLSSGVNTPIFFFDVPLYFALVFFRVIGKTWRPVILYQMIILVSARVKLILSHLRYGNYNTYWIWRRYTLRGECGFQPVNSAIPLYNISSAITEGWNRIQYKGVNPRYQEFVIVLQQFISTDTKLKTKTE